MAYLVEGTLYDLRAALPQVTSLTKENLDATRSGGLFVCALGFEDRCLSIPRWLVQHGYRFHRAIFLTLQSNSEADRRHEAELSGLLRQLASNVESIDADGGGFHQSLAATIVQVARDGTETVPRVVFDISTAANRLLLRCIRVLIEETLTLDIVYAEAALYHPTKDEFDQEPHVWQSDEELGTEQGVYSVSLSFTYPGQQIESLPHRVFAFPSFRHERTWAAISKVDPALGVRPGDQVVWLIGLPHLHEDAWRTDAMRTLNRIPPDSPLRYVSTFDYTDSVLALESLYGQYGGSCNITLSPLGSKLQGIGVALFLFMHQDVAVVFSVPKQYNVNRWSDGCRAQWLVPLGSSEALRAALMKVGELRIEEAPSGN